MSIPFRTNKGFHLIKILDRHSFRGKVKLAHILVSLAPNASSDEATVAKKKIDEAYEYLKRNEPFEGVCRAFSEDPRTKDNGGVMNRFWDAGTLIDQKIVETVFALKEKTTTLCLFKPHWVGIFSDLLKRKVCQNMMKWHLLSAKNQC